MIPHYADGTLGVNFGRYEVPADEWWQGKGSFKTGTTIESTQGAEFTFAWFTAGAQHGDVVSLIENAVTGELEAAPLTAVARVGVVYAERSPVLAPLAVPANSYAFVQVRGVAEVKVPASTAAAAALLTSATAGQATATAGGSPLSGIRLAETASAAANYPPAVAASVLPPIPAVVPAYVVAKANLNFPTIG
jgi:hypothetical protein